MTRYYRRPGRGHTTTIAGGREDPKDLSARRAAVMVKKLVAKGVPPDEIISRGMGSTQPLVKLDNTPAKQAQNRRYAASVFRSASGL
jgi:OmpA-OmpF porin, OOP family